MASVNHSFCPLMLCPALHQWGVLFHIVTQGPRLMNAHHMDPTIAISGEAIAEEVHIGF